MIKTDCENYRRICAQIDDIRTQLNGRYATDSVTVCTPPSYTPHTATVSGYIPDSNTLSLLVQLSDLEHRRDAVVRFVDNSPENIRYIMQQKYYHGKTNLYIALKLGYSDEKIIRTKIKKYFQEAEKADLSML